MLTPLVAETRDGCQALRRHRGLFALLWTGLAFALVFSPISVLFPLMTLGHFGGSYEDAAPAEIAFSAGMIVASAAACSAWLPPLWLEPCGEGTTKEAGY